MRPENFPLVQLIENAPPHFSKPWVSINSRRFPLMEGPGQLMEINGNPGPINGSPPVPLMEGPPPFNGKDRPFPLNAGGVVVRDRLVGILGNL